MFGFEGILCLMAFALDGELPSLSAQEESVLRDVRAFEGGSGLDCEGNILHIAAST